MKNAALKVGDMSILFQKWPDKKNPVIAVRFDGENVVYKIASFNSEETANWFLECLQERMN